MRYFDSCDLPIWHLVSTKLANRLPKSSVLCYYNVIKMSFYVIKMSLSNYKNEL